MDWVLFSASSVVFLMGNTKFLFVFLTSRVKKYFREVLFCDIIRCGHFWYNFTHFAQVYVCIYMYISIAQSIFSLHYISTVAFACNF